MASAGVVGLAVGFAAKDTLSNLIAGVFIMADAQYKINDLIILDSGERGLVTHIGLRSTRLLTRDDIEITVPNAVMGQAKITNETGGPKPQRRLRVPVGVAYGSDIDLVREILLRVALDEKLISDFSRSAGPDSEHLAPPALISSCSAGFQTHYSKDGR